MAGYLDNFGVADAKRENIRKKIFYTVLGLLIVSVTMYFLFRNYREEKQLTIFYDLLREQKYQTAYEMWGCTEKTPCRDYSFARFQEDWGSKSKHADLKTMKVVEKRSCDSGIIQTVNFGGNEEVRLWVERSDRTIGFAPSPLVTRACRSWIDILPSAWRRPNAPASSLDTPQ